MKVVNLAEFTGGWVVGNFDPSLFKNQHVEVAVKHYLKGEIEPEHYQRTATEYTILVSGSCRLGGAILLDGQIAVIEPLEPASFEALTDCSLVAIKSPSIPEDKVLGHL
jgi:hypothetical protein